MAEVKVCRVDIQPVERQGKNQEVRLQKTKIRILHFRNLTSCLE